MTGSGDNGGHFCASTTEPVAVVRERQQLLGDALQLRLELLVRPRLVGVEPADGVGEGGEGGAAGGGGGCGGGGGGSESHPLGSNGRCRGAAGSESHPVATTLSTGAGAATAPEDELAGTPARKPIREDEADSGTDSSESEHGDQHEA